MDTNNAVKEDDARISEQNDWEKMESQGMNWYSFLIYFLLWAGAVINLINGFQLITGIEVTDLIEFSSFSALYSYFPGLKALDIVYGLLIVSLAVYEIVVRFALARYKKDGPRMLIRFYIANTVIPVAYLLIALAIVNVPLSAVISTRYVLSLVWSVVVIFLNRIYFKKRERLFVN